MRLSSNILLPILYTNLNYTLHLSKEHVYPKSYLKNLPKAKCDLHNIFLCPYDLNNIRSNYAFTDKLDDSFVQVTDECYVSKQKKLFYPRETDRGIIARSILYMRYRYNIRYGFMGSPEEMLMLLRWNNEFLPTQDEINHNRVASARQGRGNIFIAEKSEKMMDFL